MFSTQNPTIINMKKILQFVQITLLLIITSCSSSKDTGWDELSLKGRVQSVTAKTYEAEYKFGEITKGELTYNDNYYFVFDKDGRLLEASDFDDDGDIRFRRINTYAGDIISESEFYNSKGLLYKLKFYSNKGRFEGCVAYGASGDEEGRFTHEYDGDWLSSVKNFNADGESTGVTSYIKGCNGKIQEQITYNSEGKEESRNTYEYNGKIIVSKTHEYISSWRDYKSITKELYDKHGFVVVEREEGEFEDGEYEMGKSIVYEYEYDKAGNWIKRTSFDKTNKNSIEITEREIKYF